MDNKPSDLSSISYSYHKNFEKIGEWSFQVLSWYSLNSVKNAKIAKSEKAHVIKKLWIAN